MLLQFCYFILAQFYISSFHLHHTVVVFQSKAAERTLLHLYIYRCLQGFYTLKAPLHCAKSPSLNQLMRFAVSVVSAAVNAF